MAGDGSLGGDALHRLKITLGQAIDSSAGHSEPEPLWIDEDDWVEADIPHRPWLAPGYIMRGTVTMLSGAGAAGKSMMMVSWVCALALGKNFHGLRPNAAFKVITYNVEDDLNEQRRRLSAALRYFGETPTALKGKALRLGPKKVGTLIVRDAASGILTMTPAWEALEAQIVRLRPDVIMLDPFTELHTEGENDNTALREVVAHLRSLAVTYNLAVILIHHVRKSNGGDQPGSVDSSRGASSVPAATRVALTLCGMSEKDAENLGIPPDARSSYCRLDGGKKNYAARGDAEWFEIIARTLDNGEDTAALIPWIPPDTRVSLKTTLDIQAEVESGSPHGPWAKRLHDETPRSIIHLLLKHGVKLPAAQKQVIRELEAAGYKTQPFWDAPNRRRAEGFRSPTGAPDNYKWLPQDHERLNKTERGIGGGQ